VVRQSQLCKLAVADEKIHLENTMSISGSAVTKANYSACQALLSDSSFPHMGNDLADIAAMIIYYTTVTRNKLGNCVIVLFKF
jgi:hypothetical protein